MSALNEFGAHGKNIFICIILNISQNCVSHNITFYIMETTTRPSPRLWTRTGAVRIQRFPVTFTRCWDYLFSGLSTLRLPLCTWSSLRNFIAHSAVWSTNNVPHPKPHKFSLCQSVDTFRMRWWVETRWIS